MFIKSFTIENFKSIRSLEILLDPNLSVLTGVNNSGKTTIIEALSLWGECVNKLARDAKRSVTGKYQKGDNIVDGNVHYYDLNQLTSIWCPSLKDVFYNRDDQNTLKLSAVVNLDSSSEDLTIGFSVRISTQSRYAIQLLDESNFNYKLFDKWFGNLPYPIATYYSAPLANVIRKEDFMTPPVVQDHLAKRESFAVMRNRLYKLYHTSDFAKFQQDLSYVLYGMESTARLVLKTSSDINRDREVIIRYTIGGEIIEKDIALLGSGSLQTIEILLNVYHLVEDKKDLHLILLDEPDSHIHRDIQRRLYEVLSRTTDNNQIVITTHNESLIRSTPLQNLFHIDGSGMGTVHCMYAADLKKLNTPHFSGMYPADVTPIVAELSGKQAGLDFISAIESDMIVFTEGDDDARLLFKLFQQNIKNKNKKIMFWVMGGVTQVYDNLPAYKTFFSAIRNKKTLWDKSCLIFDKDRMTDAHMSQLQSAIEGKMQLPTYVTSVYTQEAVLLTDLHMLAALLNSYYNFNVDGSVLEGALAASLENIWKNAVLPRYSNLGESEVMQYKGTYLNRMTERFKVKNMQVSDIELLQTLTEYYQKIDITKLATKDDVAAVINGAFASLGLNVTYEAENDFYGVARQMRTGLIFDEWQKIIDFLTKCAGRE